MTKTFMILIILAASAASEEMRLRVVDRYGGTISQYEVTAVCADSTKNIIVGSASSAPSLSRLRGCSGRISSLGAKLQFVRPGEFERGVINLTVADVGDPSQPPRLMPAFVTVELPSNQGTIRSGLFVRLLFKFGDEVYTAPVDLSTGRASFPDVPAGLDELIVQRGSKMMMVTEFIVRELEREMKIKLPPEMSLGHYMKRHRVAGHWGNGC